MKLHLLVPWKAHAHKPFPVDFLGHLFQNGNPAVVVLNQVVIGGEDSGDLSAGLGGEGR